MKLGSLFSGIGGIEIALEACGYTTQWQCEVDQYAAQVLDRHWGVPNLGDITQVDWDKVQRVDALCGGFPCQDISTAGKGAGIAVGTRSGLWFEYAKCIGVLRPRVVFIENVSALAVRGLNIVLSDLAALGFDAEWGTVRASDVGAPHRRERLFIVARDANQQSRHQRWITAPGQTQGGWTRADAGGSSGASAPDNQGVRWRTGVLRGRDSAQQPQPRGDSTPAADTNGNAIRQQPERQSGGSSASLTGGSIATDNKKRGGLIDGTQSSCRSTKVVPGMWRDAYAETIQWAPRGQDCVSGQESMFPVMREYEDSGDTWDWEMESPSDPEPSSFVRGVWIDGRSTPAPHRQEPFEQRPTECPCHVCVSSSQTALARRSRVAYLSNTWSQFAPAIERWEYCYGVEAPSPLDERGRLNVELTEWMMGFPAGWTDGLPRSQRLKCLGNAVVPHAAASAFSALSERAAP